MDSLTRAEIRRLYDWHLQRIIVGVAIFGIIGGMIIGVAIGVTIVTLDRGY